METVRCEALLLGGPKRNSPPCSTSVSVTRRFLRRASNRSTRKAELAELYESDRAVAAALVAGFSELVPDLSDQLWPRIADSVEHN